MVKSHSVRAELENLWFCVNTYSFDVRNCASA
jgi:hypothetical protein